MRQVLCTSCHCAKDLSVFGAGRYWDHLSLYGHRERIKIQNHSRNKEWDSGKDHGSLFAAKREAIKSASNGFFRSMSCTSSWIGILWRKYVLRLWEHSKLWWDKIRYIMNHAIASIVPEHTKVWKQEQVCLEVRCSLVRLNGRYIL